LADVDDFEGIEINRTIGPLAYLLHDFADAVGWAEQELRTQLLNHPGVPPLFFRGMAYRERTYNMLEQQLGMKVEELAFSLFVVVMQFNRNPIELPPIIQQRIDHPQFLPIRYPGRIEAERSSLSNNHINMIKRLFEDCFKLRENVYDGLLLEELADAITPEQALARVQTIDTSSLSVDFRLNEEPLSTVLMVVQNEVATLTHLKENLKVKAVLVSICQAGLYIDEPSQQLIALMKLSGNIEQQISDFLTHCSLLELHKALCLAYHADQSQYEHSLTLLHHALTVLEEQANQPPIRAASYKRFAREEIDMLTQFTQQDFRISMSQLDATLLTKVADQFPELYRRLELRLVRG
jgi:hypothetical protein